MLLKLSTVLVIASACAALPHDIDTVREIHATTTSGLVHEHVQKENVAVSNAPEPYISSTPEDSDASDLKTDNTFWFGFGDGGRHHHHHHHHPGYHHYHHHHHPGHHEHYYGARYYDGPEYSDW